MLKFIKRILGHNASKADQQLANETELATDSSHQLHSRNSPEISVLQSKSISQSYQSDRDSIQVHEIDVDSLSYVPLPRSPLQWEEAQAGRERAAIPVADEQFEVYDADWQITTIDMIPLAERPDTAFRQMYPTDSGIIMIDDLGKADGLGEIEAAALRYDRMGALAAKKGFLHSIYRVGVHPLGCGLITMSRDCVIHAYNDNLESIFDTPLMDTPEISALKKRFDISDDQLKNHIRCVSLSMDASRYLFTAVDRAWCIDISGKGLWNAKLPLKEGWRQFAPSSNEFGTSDDVNRALALMELSFPITPEELKQRYRELAKRWHPDLNSHDPEAGEKMKQLTFAAEVLTGIEAEAIPRYTDAIFVREMKRMEVEVDGINFSISCDMQVGEIHALDWIYAAAFAARSHEAYLASYSGRVVQVDENGNGIRVYDIGSVPRRIVDTGNYLYFLTDTRLYVLLGDALHTIVDTFDSGDLVVAQKAFGLIEQKRLRWFNEDGKYLGSVISKDPIRRIYSSEQGMVLETRKRRAVVQGIPNWWE